MLSHSLRSDIYIFGLDKILSALPDCLINADSLDERMWLISVGRMPNTEGLNLEKVESCLKILESQNINQKRILNIVQDYKSENVSEKIVRIILSYTDYVNQFIWKK